MLRSHDADLLRAAGGLSDGSAEAGAADDDEEESGR